MGRDKLFCHNFFVLGFFVGGVDVLLFGTMNGAPHEPSLPASVLQTRHPRRSVNSLMGHAWVQARRHHGPQK